MVSLLLIRCYFLNCTYSKSNSRYLFNISKLEFWNHLKDISAGDYKSSMVFRNLVARLEIYKIMINKNLPHFYKPLEIRKASNNCQYRWIWLPILICLELSTSWTMFRSRILYDLDLILQVRGYSLVTFKKKVISR